VFPNCTGWPVNEQAMMNTETTVVSARKPTEENGSARSADWDNPRVASILSAAAKCFARKGFTATTLAEIGKELGLRKSIVHYYFASKAALIHEVQSFTYHRYLDRLKEAIRNGDGSSQQATDALRALWDAIQNNKTGTGLNIEVWSAARRDSELKRRAAGLQRDARQVIRDVVAPVTSKSGPAKAEALATLALAVLNGLSVTEYLEGEEAKVQEAYATFLELLRSSFDS
jgi:AcrR family transcriptional regulator